jgi:hypothetical protein
MNNPRAFQTGRGTRQRQSHIPPIPTTPSDGFPTQATHFQPPHFPFQELPAPKGPAPFRYDLTQLLAASDINRIKDAGVLVFHSVGDSGDPRGQQKNFVAGMMTDDANQLPDAKKPAFFYHLGDVVYFAGDVDKYGDNFYAVYEDYPAFIVSIPGNHDCQPDDPQDGPVDPNKKSWDGWVQNFMSGDPNRLGSLKTNSARTQMDLPNVYWTFTTPMATIIGLASNVSETQGEFHADQVAWFQGELAAADPALPLIVAVHHPAYSGDTEHSGSSEVERVLLNGFEAAKRWPNLVLSGHVHNYQRFTKVLQTQDGRKEIPFVVAGSGGFTNPKPLHPVSGIPLDLGNGLSLEGDDDHRNYGFLRIEVSRTQIVGIYQSAPFSHGGGPAPQIVDTFVVDVASSTVRATQTRQRSAHRPG